MKTVKLFSAMIAFVALANFALAGGKASLDITPLSKDRVIISATSETPESYYVTLKSKDGQVIYETKARNTVSYKKIYDLSKLSNGEYSLAINNKNFKTERKFSISGNDINVGEQHFVIAPVFTYRDNILRVSYLNYEDEPVTFMVYDNNDVIYKKTIGSNFAIHEGVSLEKLRNGSYSVILSNTTDNYSYTVKK